MDKRVDGHEVRIDAAYPAARRRETEIRLSVIRQRYPRYIEKRERVGVYLCGSLLAICVRRSVTCR